MSKKERWTFGDMPDQTGRIALVTGANTGIGYETALAFAGRNATVVMACRSLEKGAEARDRILSQAAEADVQLMHMDLGSLTSVRKFADAFRDQSDQLDLLINNAGVMVPPFTKTEDGFELQFGVNHLGHFALTGLLLSLISSTPRARIVTVSSEAHRRCKIDFDNLNGEKSYSSWPFYGRSKLANLLFTNELQRRLGAAGHSTLAIAAHPGWTATDLQRHTGLVNSLNGVFAMPSDQGALPTLFAATAPDVSGGGFFGPDGIFNMRGYPTEVRAAGRAHDLDTAARLWQISEQLTGVRFEFAADAPKPSAP